MPPRDRRAALHQRRIEILLSCQSSGHQFGDAVPVREFPTPVVTQRIAIDVRERRLQDNLGEPFDRQALGHWFTASSWKAGCRTAAGTGRCSTARPCARHSSLNRPVADHRKLVPRPCLNHSALLDDVDGVGVTDGGERCVMITTVICRCSRSMAF